MLMGCLASRMLLYVLQSLHQQIRRTQHPQNRLLKGNAQNGNQYARRQRNEGDAGKIPRLASSGLPSPILRAQTALPPAANMMAKPPVSIPKGKTILIAERAFFADIVGDEQPVINRLENGKEQRGRQCGQYESDQLPEIKIAADPALCLL